MFKSVSILMLGTAIAQLINFASSPILTRLYSPEDFGLFSLYSGFLTTLGITLSWRYEAAIVLPKINQQARYVLSLSLILSIVSFLILYPTLLISGEYIALILKSPRIEDIIILISFGIFIFSVNRSYAFWLTRKKHYKLLAGSRVIYAGMTALGSISLAVFTDIEQGLIYGGLLGVSSSVFLVFILDAKQVSVSNSTKRLMSVFYKYKKFPIQNLVPSLMAAVGLILPVFFVSGFYGVENAGYFGLAVKVLLLPATILAQALSQYLLGEISEMYRQGKDFSFLIVKVIKILSMVSIPFVFILTIWGEPLFSFIFGPTWMKSGTIAQFLAISIAVRFISASVSGALIATYSIEKVSMWQITYFFSMVSVLYFGGYFLDNILDFLLVYAASDIILYLFYLYLVMSIRNKKYNTKMHKTAK